MPSTPPPTVQPVRVLEKVWNSGREQKELAPPEQDALTDWSRKATPPVT